ncbi:Trimethylguanosine synthase [Orchesella cincta]|uniref:Trimethylguanosine synthase n=1 Tax=Orchesella cincta TaxID=48709 RepID=A0A1D2NKE4_ORCCI|nr:Trimethylguanosine synthase [Orchesella cincta]
MSTSPGIGFFSGSSSDASCDSDSNLHCEKENNNEDRFQAAWKDFWSQNGEKLTWESWCEKYGDYMNADFNILSSYTLPSSAEEVPAPEEEDKLSTDQVGWQEKWEEHVNEIYKTIYYNFFNDQWLPSLEKMKISKGDANLPKKKGGKNKKKKKNRRHSGVNVAELPLELQARTDLHKYWAQRFELFSRFNAGIQLDAESWFSVTPEVIAAHIAERCQTDGTILDAFCGCGGNTIQFAKHCGKVIAVDIDPQKIEYCKQNARIYGVEDKIEFIVGDFTQLASSLQADVVFLSPPWGGPLYSSLDKFDIETMIPGNGEKLFHLTQNISRNIAYFLPRNVDRDQITKLAGEGNYVDIESNLHRGKPKAITAYYGDLVHV